MTATERRSALVQDARRAIARVSRPLENWVPEGGADHDVVVIGGGQSGLSIGFALKRAGINRFAIFDQAPEGWTNWNSTARMNTLRTPKTITGLEQGIPELTFEAFYDGLHGEGSFAKLGKIPTRDWSTYVDWFREVVEVPVTWATRLVDVASSDGFLSLTFSNARSTFGVTTRKLVLATGMGGLGRAVVPETIASLPRSLWSHTHDDINFAALAGKRIGVLGAASSAFDNAATALEQGAASADLFCRHPQLAIQRVDSKLTLITELHVTRHFIDLPEELRWRLIARGRVRGVVPEESITRAEAQAGFRLHLGHGWDRVTTDGNVVHVQTGGGTFTFDHLIAATGYDVDIHARPELARLAPHAALWRDRYVPPSGEEDAGKAAYPYLGPHFEFLERIPGAAPWLGQVHLFGYAAILNHGFHVGDISSMGSCVPRLVDGIAREFFLADTGHHLSSFVDRRETVPIDLPTDEPSSATSIAPKERRHA
ncbi:NAD(P)-binding domain-containing protein [Rhizobium puerariae]|uniref:NAD(P)-binding domain-containing protein n=1 Tax=Rhizobium puerariae TaxID=1585791 RepID=A0ABV6ADK0_9HYPH